jgi:hypothetical protein
MSLLTSTAEDFAPRGRTLPERVYLAEVEEAAVEVTEAGDNGEPKKQRLTRRYGNIRLPDGTTEFQLADGSTFRIGNRKLFNRSWTVHTSAEAQRIGNGEIKREAVAAGLMEKPTKEKPSELNYPSWDEYANALVGKTVRVRVRHEVRVDRATGKVVNDPATDAPIVDARVADYLTGA